MSLDGGKPHAPPRPPSPPKHSRDASDQPRRPQHLAPLHGGLGEEVHGDDRVHRGPADGREVPRAALGFHGEALGGVRGLGGEQAGLHGDLPEVPGDRGEVHRGAAVQEGEGF